MLYSAPKKEITALAVDAQGNIYAAGAGEKRGARFSGESAPAVGTVSALRSNSRVGQPSTGDRSCAPGIHAAPYPNVTNLVALRFIACRPTARPRRSGLRATTWSMRWLSTQAGRLLAGTGNKGRMYAIIARQPVHRPGRSQRQPGDGLRACAEGRPLRRYQQSGQGFSAWRKPRREGTYESDVFDAKNFSKWGRVEVRGSGQLTNLFARSGNVDNPDRNWSPWKKVDLQKDLPVDAPSARFMQWKAVLHAGKPATRASTA